MKTRIFENINEYLDYYDEHEHEPNDVDIVKGGNNECADGEFECKSWKTAVKRLAKATGWDWILGELECDEHRDSFLPDCDSVQLECIDNNLWYVAARQCI